MSLNKSLLAAGILVVSGFFGGFLVSKGSGQVLGMKPVHAASSTSGNADEQIAAGIVNASAGDEQGGTDGRHPRLHQGGGGGAADGAQGQGGDSSTSVANPDDASGHGAKPGQTVMLAGPEAAALLVGNTVDGSFEKAAPQLTFYAPRGFRADGNERGFVVKPWDRGSNALCEPGSDGAQICRPLQIRGETGDHAAGSRIGTLRVAGDRWVPIYKGNLLNVPNHIPVVDSAVAEAAPAEPMPKVTTKGQGAVDKLVGHAAVVDAPEGSGDQADTIFYYTDDGRRAAVKRPGADADDAGGIKVSMGRWTFVKGTFCQGDGAPGSVQTCSKPEAWGRRGIRFAPGKTSPELRLTIVAETPKPRTEAAN